MAWIDLFKKQAKEQEKESPETIIGSSATEIYGGYLAEEYLGEIIEIRERYKIYDQMRRQSGVMKMLYKASASPIRSTQWGFRPLKGNEENSMATGQVEFMEAAFPDNLFKKLVKDMTSSLVFGFYLGERYYQPFEYNGKLFLRPKVKYFSQRSVERWMVDRQEGLIGIDQESYGDVAAGGSVFIGRDRLVHFAIDQEGDNYEGISPFRMCLGNWRRKNVNYQKIAVGNNFLAIPFISVEQSKDAQGRLEEEDLERLSSVLKKRSKGDTTLSHIVPPKGFTLNEIGSNFDPVKLYECNDREDQEMIKSFCANFLLLTGKTGSFALGESLAKFFMQSLDEMAGGMDRAITDDLVKPTIELNLGEEVLIEAYHTEIDQRGSKDLAEVLNVLKQSRFIKLGSKDESWAREKFGLRERMEDDIVEEPPPEPPPMPGEEPPTNPFQQQSKKKVQLSKSSIKSQANGSAKRLRKLQEKISDEYEKQLTLVVEKKIKKLRTALAKTDISKAKVKLADFEVNASKEVKAISDIVLSAYDEETKSLENALALAKPKSKSQIRAMFKNTTEADLADIISKMDNQLLYLLYESIDQFTDLDALVELLSSSAIKTVSAGKAKSTVLPAKAVNTARRESFAQHSEEIESYSFYNSSPVAEICKYLAGRTIKAGDPDVEAYTPPLHYNCATVMIPNLKEFKDNPEPKPLAPSQKQIDSVNIGIKAALY